MPWCFLSNKRHHSLLESCVLWPKHHPLSSIALARPVDKLVSSRQFYCPQHPMKLIFLSFRPPCHLSIILIQCVCIVCIRVRQTWGYSYWRSFCAQSQITNTILQRWSADSMTCWIAQVIILSFQFLSTRAPPVAEPNAWDRWGCAFLKFTPSTYDNVPATVYSRTSPMNSLWFSLPRNETNTLV